jgi:hypothetical protein
MKYCIYCGQELNDDATFCTKCGKEQVKKDSASANKKEYKGSNGLGFAIASLCVFYFPIVSLVFGLIGLTYGIKANKISSIVISIISLCLMLAFDIALSIYCCWYFIPMIIANLPHETPPALANTQAMLSLIQLL